MYEKKNGNGKERDLGYETDVYSNDNVAGRREQSWKRDRYGKNKLQGCEQSLK